MTASTRQFFPALQHFSAEDMDALASTAPVQRFAVGDLLCEQGKPGDSCFLLVSGQVEVIRGLGERSVSVATLGKGEIVGQMALVDGSPRSASVRVVAPVTAMVLSRDVFESLLAAESPIALRFQKQVVTAGVRQLRKATAQLARVLLAAVRSPEDTQASQQALVDPETAVRTLAGLSELAVDLAAPPPLPADATEHEPHA